MKRVLFAWSCLLWGCCLGLTACSTVDHSGSAATVTPPNSVVPSTSGIPTGDSGITTVTPNAKQLQVVAYNKDQKPLYAPQNAPFPSSWPWEVTSDSWGPIQLGAPLPDSAKEHLSWKEMPPLCQAAWVLEEFEGIKALVATIDNEKDKPVYRITIIQPGIKLSTGGAIGDPITKVDQELFNSVPGPDGAKIAYQQTVGQVTVTLLGQENNLDQIDIVPADWGLGGDLFATEWHC